MQTAAYVIAIYLLGLPIVYGVFYFFLHSVVFSSNPAWTKQSRRMLIIDTLLWPITFPLWLLAVLALIIVDFVLFIDNLSDRSHN